MLFKQIISSDSYLQLSDYKITYFLTKGGRERHHSPFSSSLYPDRDQIRPFPILPMLRLRAVHHDIRPAFTPHFLSAVSPWTIA